jgi:hypothetical protein
MIYFIGLVLVVIVAVIVERMELVEDGPEPESDWMDSTMFGD